MALIIFIAATAVIFGCGKKTPAAAATAPQRDLNDVIADFIRIASTDWSEIEESGKAAYEAQLRDDQVIINDIKEAGKTAKKGEQAYIDYHAYLLAQEQARKATLTPKEKAAEGIVEGIDTASELIDKGCDFVDELLNGSEDE